MKHPHVLVISFDAVLAESRHNRVSQRQIEYANKTGSWNIINLFPSYKYGTYKEGNYKIINAGLNPLKIIPALVKFQKHPGINVITTQDPLWTGLLGVFITFVLRKPLLVQMHSDMIFSKEWRSESWLRTVHALIIKFCLSKATSIRVVNQKTATKLSKLFNENKKIIVSPISVDNDYFYKPIKQKQSYNSFICVSRLSKEKNVSLVIKAFSKVYKQNNQVHLTIVGNGDEQDHLKKLVAELRMDRAVSFLGHLEKKQLKAAYHKSDAFILGSNHESYGMVFLEAMAAGLPIIATNTSAVGTVLFDQKNALISKISDVEGMAANIKRLVTDPKLAYQLGAEGQRLVKLLQTKQNTWIDELVSISV